MRAVTNFSIAVLVLLADVFVKPVRTSQPHYQWPHECTGQTYCDVKPSYYPEKLLKELLDSEGVPPTNFDSGIEPREGDLACSSRTSRSPRKIYLIKDNNDRIRFVAQSDKFEIKIIVEECRNSGPIKRSPYFRRDVLRAGRVHCKETKSFFGLPVLSLDQTSLDLVTPKGGIPVSCASKIML